MSDIYDQHKAAFASVSAYVILDGANERVASVAFKFPRDGAGRLYCYLHVFGTPMVRGFASGCGYDKRSAAMHVATRKIVHVMPMSAETITTVAAIKAAIQDRGYDWTRELEHAGFKVLQAV